MIHLLVPWRRSVEEVHRICASCSPLWRACTAVEFCPVRTRRAWVLGPAGIRGRAEAEAEVERLDTQLPGLEDAEGHGEASAAWKTPEALVFDVSDSEEGAPEVPVKQEPKVKQEVQGEARGLCGEWPLGGRPVVVMLLFKLVLSLGR